MTLAAAILAGALAATSGAAQVVSDCQWENTAQMIVEPWEAHTRTFSNGATRLTVLDRLEPGDGSMHLHVLSPPRDELGARQCKIVSFSWTHGFAEIFWEGLQAGYDPARGLLFDLPVQFYNGANARFQNAMLSMALNQSTGTLDAILNPVD